VKRVVAIFLSISLLISNIGFVYGIHYCCGEPIHSGLSINGLSNLDCGMVINSARCKAATQLPRLAPTDCCTDYIVHITIESDYEEATIPVNQSDCGIVTIMPSTFSNHFMPTSHPGFGYSPPLLNRDIQVLIQSFLI